jgi:hypothetical protein
MTPWTPPTTLVQYAESGADSLHIAWSSTESFPTTTRRDLRHTARSPKLDDLDRTWYLCLTDYRFATLPQVISGIQVRIDINRRGRISDDTVQLVYQGEPIGKNLAQPASDQTIERATTLLPSTVYGGDVASWALDTVVDPAMIRDPAFGVLVRFMAHPRWPHRDSAILHSVELQIY